MVGGGVSESYLYPIYGGIVLLAAMQFEDENFSDLKLTGDDSPGTVKVGDNLHIVKNPHPYSHFN